MCECVYVYLCVKYEPEERHVLFGEREELPSPITVDAVAMLAAIVFCFSLSQL